MDAKVAIANTVRAIVAGKGTILLEVVYKIVDDVVVVFAATQAVPVLSATLGAVQVVTH